jgi:hypothetical protein
VTEELHGRIQNELDNENGDVDELEDGAGRGVEKFGDNGVGGLVPNDIALELGIATCGHEVVPVAVFADSEDIVLYGWERLITGIIKDVTALEEVPNNELEDVTWSGERFPLSCRLPVGRHRPHPNRSRNPQMCLRRRSYNGPCSQSWC